MQKRYSLIAGAAISFSTGAVLVKNVLVSAEDMGKIATLEQGGREMSLGELAPG